MRNKKKLSAGLLAFVGILSITLGTFLYSGKSSAMPAYDYDEICANYDAYWEPYTEIPTTDEFPSEAEIIEWSFEDVEDYVSNHYDLIEEYTIQWNRLGHIWNYVNDRETYNFDEEEYIDALK